MKNVTPVNSVNGELLVAEKLYLFPDRSSYAPTAVNPYALWENDSTRYNLASLHRVVDIFQDDELKAKFSKALLELMETVAYAAHTDRLNYNSGKKLAEDATEFTRQLFRYAETGRANPAELLILLANQPNLGDIELARQTHPGDRDSSVMDQAITDSLLLIGDNVTLFPPSLSDKKVETEILRPHKDEQLHAFAIARKKLFAAVTIDGTNLFVYKRRIRTANLDAPDAPTSLDEAIPLINMLENDIETMRNERKDIEKSALFEFESSDKQNRRFEDMASLSLRIQQRSRERFDHEKLRRLEQDKADYLAEIGSIVNETIIAGDNAEWLQPITTSYFVLTEERAREQAGKSAKSAAVHLP